MRYPYRERKTVNSAKIRPEFTIFKNFLKKSVSVGNPIKAFVVIYNEKADAPFHNGIMSIAHSGEKCNSFLLHKVRYKVTNGYKI